ncbi:MAG: hypothetical protein HYZ21_03045 [Chloroflexi bacterium]|nr:hypothetical protein [Chloroflexota bacterium]
MISITWRADEFLTKKFNARPPRKVYLLQGGLFYGNVVSIKLLGSGY